MGRGRQKAKQTKVARELKYHSTDIDVSALQRELGNMPVRPLVVDDDDDDDQYSQYADRYNIDDDEDDGDGRQAARG